MIVSTRSVTGPEQNNTEQNETGPSETEYELATQLFLSVGQLARWSARQSPERYGPGVLSALGTVVDIGPLRLGELATRVGVLPASMSRMVATLEAESLVVRVVDPADRRSSFIAATALGTQLVTERRRTRGAQLARELAPLTDAQLEALRTIIDAINELTSHERDSGTDGGASSAGRQAFSGS